MAKLIHNGVEIANTLQRYDDVINKPLINGAELKVGNNTSIDLGIIWHGTQEEYDAIDEVDPNTIYLIQEDEADANDDDYNKLSNQPAINGVVLTGDKSLASLNLYSKTEVDDLISSSKSVIVVSKEEWEEIHGDPTKLKRNQIYYVATDVEGEYQNYLVDNDGAIHPLNSGSADMTVYQLKHPTDASGADIIKAGDGTVVGALNSIGDVSTLTTTNKDTVVDAINELNDNKYDNTSYIKRYKGRFGEWNNTTKDRYYKLATLTFSANYQSFNGTLKLMTTYSTIKLTGAEIGFNFRCTSGPAAACEIYEMTANNVSADFAKSKAEIIITYNSPSAYPKTCEIWLRTISSTYNEFTYEWAIRSVGTNAPLPAINIIEQPPVAASMTSLGTKWSYDIWTLCSSRKSVELYDAALTGRTRANLVSASGTRTEYVFGNVKFTAAEGPTKNTTDAFNVHVMYQASNKILLVATNPANGLIYTSFYNGSTWSAWVETGATGDPGKLVDATNDIKFTAVLNCALAEKKYYYVDMGTYYINWLYLGIKWVSGSIQFNNSGKWCKIEGIKGKTAPGSDVGAPYFSTVFADPNGSAGHGNCFIKQDGNTYIDVSTETNYSWLNKMWQIVQTFISYK